MTLQGSLELEILQSPLSLCTSLNVLCETDEKLNYQKLILMHVFIFTISNIYLYLRQTN